MGKSLGERLLKLASGPVKTFIAAFGLREKKMGGYYFVKNQENWEGSISDLSGRWRLYWNVNFSVRSKNK